MKQLTAILIGDVVSIGLAEAVGNIHFSHSFVRGNWHSEKESLVGGHDGDQNIIRDLYDYLRDNYFKKNNYENF